ncbi:hypothetical protein [Roseiterribacter gracilis]|uniref:Uncharacterized protein n=1 Tax=Roseiterribacter gracilis TaxID=2812848 RepID=A0A8S8X7C7_9PROT|nr:hypothetical protein TMPK1_17350 [Rhodospirillales bacterium TMPK1]
MNPELQRNFWLELSPARVGFTAVAIALVYLSAMMVPGNWLHGSGTTLLLFAVTGLWGSRRAADAIPDELAGRTWDTQRLSVISPWSMCWGKLFGVTSLVWIATALTLIGHAVIGGASWSEIIATTASCVLWQVASFWASLLLLRLGGQRVRGHTTVAQLLGLAAVGVSSVWSWPRAWYGIDFDQHTMRTVLSLFLIALTLFGAWRATRVELQARNLPWGLALCLALLFVFQAGFAPVGNVPNLKFQMQDISAASAALSGGLLLAAATLLGAVTVTSFLTPKDPIALRSWIEAVRAGQARRALELQPPFVTALAMAFLATVIAIALTGGVGGFLLPSTFLLMLRDVALVLTLTVGARTGRAHLAALVLLALLHVVVPPLARVLIGPFADLVFRPSLQSVPVVLLVEAVLANALLVWRLKAVGAMPTSQRTQLSAA